MLTWKRSPALYVALLVLIGASSAIFPPLLGFTLLFKKRLLWVIPLLMLLYTKIVCPFLPVGDRGAAHFHIVEVVPHAGPIKTTLCYRGKVKTFAGEGGNYRNLPTRIYLPLGKKRPPAHTDYLVWGTLEKISPGSYILKPDKGRAWIPLSSGGSLAKWRYMVKKKVKASIYSRFTDKKVAAVLSALATGHLESRFFAYKFNAVGLQHLLAISGFHFALLAFLLACILKRLFGEKTVALILILCLSTYFFYMGAAPSISRAWIGILAYLTGQLLGYRSSPLNTLGIALLVALLCDPLIFFHIGFQLSFGATLGILLFYQPLTKCLEHLFPKRPYSTLQHMTRGGQCGALLCAYFRSALALQGGALTLTLPLLLYHFQKFPLASLFYNLFFPLLLSLLIALFFLRIDFLVKPLALFLLSLVENAPKKLLFSLSPGQAVTLLSTFILCWGGGKMLRSDCIRRARYGGRLQKILSLFFGQKSG